MLKNFVEVFVVLLAVNFAAGTRSDWDALPNLGDVENVKTYELPLIDDPLIIEDFELPLETEFSSGRISLQNGNVTGLSGLNVSLNVNLIEARITVNVTLPQARITGQYGANVTLLLSKLLPELEIDILQLEGNGNIITTQISNLRISVVIDLDSTGTPDGKLSVKEIDIPVSFNTVSINLVNFKVNGVLVPWLLVIPLLKPTFTQFWNENEDAISAALVPIGTEIIKNCTLNDLANGCFECLNLGGIVSIIGTCDEEGQEGSSSSTPETDITTTTPATTNGTTTTTTTTTTETSAGYSLKNTGFQAFTLLCVIVAFCY